MPYIPKERRIELDFFIDELIKKMISVGELNYTITRLVDDYSRKYMGKEGVNYPAYNSMIGVLECVKQEYYRRRVVPYETKKIIDNGEVYD